MLDKNLIEAAEPHYFNFILNALTGHNPDDFFRQNEQAIRYYARALREASRLQACQVYRGLLLESHEIKEMRVQPMDHITFLSFSESREIAECFADIEHPMAIFVRRQRPTVEGYVIEHLAQPDEIIFHWQWAKPLLLHRYVDTKVIFEQKEVMLFQTNKAFDLKPFPRGGSSSHGYNPGII